MPSFNNLKIKWKITLAAAIVFLPAMAGGTFYFYQQVYDLEVKNALGGLMNFVDAKQQGVIRFLGQNEKFARQLAVLAQEAEPGVLRKYFKEVVESDVFQLKNHPFASEIEDNRRQIPTWRTYQAIDLVRNGSIVLSSDPAREGRAWRTEIDLRYGYSDVWREGDKAMLTFGAPVAGGMVYVHADARMLTNIVNGEIGNLEGDMGTFYLAGVSKTFDYYMVNADNRMITESRTRPDALLKLQGSRYPWQLTQQTEKTINCSQGGTYVTNAGITTGCREAMGFYEGPQGKLMLGASMPFYDSGWSIVVEQEAEELLGPLAQLRNLMLVIGTLLGGFSFLSFIYVVNHYVTRPLSRLTGTIKALAATDGEFDLTRRHEANQHDEIGDITQVVNDLLDAFVRIVLHIRRDAEQVSSTVAHLTTTYNSLAESSRHQMDSATSVAAAVEQLTGSISQVASAAGDTSDLATQDLAYATDGAQVAESTAQEMERIAQSVEDSSRLVDALNTSAGQISGIIQVIRGIAEQTNLLALNAAIEAARAGENGRGFAVVADEVRALAARTQQATTEIGQLIESINSEVTATVGSMELTREQASQGVSMVARVRQALDNIRASARETAAKVSSIAAATRMQSTTSDEVAHNAESISRSAETNHAAAQETSHAAGQLRELAQHLQQAVAHFKTGG
ncbi:methyl-accepting chemotaxis protein [Sedimenticola hydrogenitrophicus]|uniref:methyl-accepting chemotaxis protein n=1 Tax=Sedimenticola hydrogenitrophicus TaxID=2967975 RepID=UPI0021A30C3A|nr:methyl-accepting chemotaxis protein [Sedimenticola hydrogenitrophicus]